MLVQDLANYLVANGLCYVPESVTFPWVFCNWRPEDPDKLIVISDYMTTEPLVTMNGAAKPIVERPRVQVLVRDTPEAAVACYNTAREVYKKLCLILDLPISGTLYSLVPLDSPAMIGRDDQQRVNYAMNFQVTMQEP